MKTGFALLTSMMTVVGWSTITKSASFDCTRAAQPIEVIICSDNAIDAADTRLGLVYDALRVGLSIDDWENIRQAQRIWIRSRAAICGPFNTTIVSDDQRNCIVTLTNARISDLSLFAEEAGVSVPATSSPAPDAGDGGVVVAPQPCAENSVDPVCLLGEAMALAHASDLSEPYPIWIEIAEAYGAAGLLDDAQAAAQSAEQSLAGSSVQSDPITLLRYRLKLVPALVAAGNTTAARAIVSEALSIAQETANRPDLFLVTEIAQAMVTTEDQQGAASMLRAVAEGSLADDERTFDLWDHITQFSEAQVASGDRGGALATVDALVAKISMRAPLSTIDGWELIVLLARLGQAEAAWSLLDRAPDPDQFYDKLLAAMAAGMAEAGLLDASDQALGRIGERHGPYFVWQKTYGVPIARRFAEAGRIDRAISILSETLRVFDEGAMRECERAVGLLQVAGLQAEIGDLSGAYRTSTRIDTALSSVTSAECWDGYLSRISLLGQLASAEVQAEDAEAAAKVLAAAATAARETFPADNSLHIRSLIAVAYRAFAIRAIDPAIIEAAMSETATEPPSEPAIRRMDVQAIVDLFHDDPLAATARFGEFIPIDFPYSRPELNGDYIQMIDVLYPSARPDLTAPGWGWDDWMRASQIPPVYVRCFFPRSSASRISVRGVGMPIHATARLMTFTAMSINLHCLADQ